MNTDLKFKYVCKRHNGLKVEKVFTLKEIESGIVPIWARNNHINTETDLFHLRFTGKKDKNGVDIYEGDVTNCGIIVWNNNLHWDGGGSIHSGFYLMSLLNIFGADDNVELDYHTGFGEDIELLGYNITIDDKELWKHLCWIEKRMY